MIAYPLAWHISMCMYGFETPGVITFLDLRHLVLQNRLRFYHCDSILFL
jgi:hypothetical protein